MKRRRPRKLHSTSKVFSGEYQSATILCMGLYDPITDCLDTIFEDVSFMAYEPRNRAFYVGDKAEAFVKTISGPFKLLAWNTEDKPRAKHNIHKLSPRSRRTV